MGIPRAVRFAMVYACGSCAVVVLSAWVVSQFVFRSRVGTKVAVSRWPVDVPSHWPHPQDVTATHGFGSEKRTYWGYTEPTVFLVVEERYGWPLPFLSIYRAYEQTFTGATSVTPVSTIAGGLRINGLPASLPLWPHLGQAAVDGLAVCSCMTLAHVAISTTRKRLRRHLRLCTKCGYAIASLTTCPECGEVAPL